MQKKNLELLVEQLDVKTKKVDEDLINILVFTGMPKYMEFFGNLTLSNLTIYHVIKLNKKYALIKNKKMYYFRKLSDIIPYKHDKKILHDIKKRNGAISLFRTLRLASLRSFINANFIIASTNRGNNSYIEYEENNEKYIVSYSDNMVMKKDDFIELYNFSEISRLDQVTLYKVHEIIEKVKTDIDIMYLLLFPDEFIKDLSKTEKYLTEKYDKSGINKNNYLITQDDGDIFPIKEDVKFSDEYNDISNFTLNPDIKNNSKFSYEKENKKYIYKKGNKKICFKLLSDLIEGNENKKQELLSENRYGTCHRDSIELLFRIYIDEDEKIYIVNGKLKQNEKDYFYHSWVEIETNGKVLVYDYNHNILMNKDDYLKLMKAKIINRTDKDSEINLLKLLHDFELPLQPIVFNYFSQELTRDLEKNKFLIKKKETE